MNKSFITNFLSLTLIIISFIFPSQYSNYLLYSGLFAFSGAVTNQLAIHMLFEKVPFLYGSGVIPARFETFKDSIKDLMMKQFFTKEQLDLFFLNEEQEISLEPIIEQTDFSPAFDSLSSTVMESSFGSMLGMFGGEKALETLREPFSNKIRKAVITIVKSEAFNTTLQKHMQTSSLSEDMLRKIENIIDETLDKLTPQIVKEIVQNLISKHLSWLVVWGGVFGGLIGLISSFLL